MTITFNEVERTIVNGLHSTENYGEVKNGDISILVQIYQPGQWRVQFYHVETGIIVQAEHIMDNDHYTLTLIHEALELLEHATVFQVTEMQRFTQNLLVVRENEEGGHKADFYPLASIKEYLQIRELFQYDEDIKAYLDGNGHYPNVQKSLKKYGITL